VVCTTDLAALWPPKHALQSVKLVVTATDACSNPGTILPITVRVSSSEPDDAPGGGDGATTGDVHGLDGYAHPVDVTSSFSYSALTGVGPAPCCCARSARATGSGASTRST
jgi:hypothetical protein